MEPHQNFLSLEHKLLNQHHDDYAAFTRLILSLAVGSFSLLAALSDKLLSADAFLAFAKAAFPLLFISILAGLFVQHRIMMNPQWHLEEAREAHCGKRSTRQSRAHSVAQKAVHS